MCYIVILLIKIFLCHLKAIVDAYKEEPGNSKYAFKVFSSVPCLKLQNFFPHPCKTYFTVDFLCSWVLSLD